MNFLQLLDGAEVLAQSGNPSVSGLEYDSRRVKPGDAFIAMRGETSDGNKFIDRAIAAGAVAILSDSANEKPRDNVAWAQVSHGRRVLARLSANFYKHPAERLALTGITGTNGKSTTAFLLEAILRAANRKSALIGTIEYHVAGKILPAPHTTPEALDLNRILAEALGNGATEAVMEVSSHALAQQRVHGIPFDVAVFTNLTRDHLDYHHTMEEYFDAKQILFEGCGTDPPRVVVLNAEDEYGQKLAKVSKKQGSEVLLYGLNSGALHAGKVDITSRGTRFDLVTPEEVLPVFSPLIGKVNVYNILAAAGAAYARACKPDEIAKGIASLARVPGRFERVDCKQPFTVVVDYAHTDDALRNLTSLAREFVQQARQKGRVITVFGCGGDRDRTKRPLMGEAAGRGSDFVILTSDNPRSEDPLAIINDAMVGLQRSGAKYKVEADRKMAIAFAIREAAAGDIVLIAGKGHEKVQVLREGSNPFDDVEVAHKALRDAGYDCEAANAAAGKNS
ncbi:MAG TPA: UDP-N-acetylmuramoyl-L-alanyl-D-glutamate--2,6-diaminopimelate ligase [Terriglobales bacterium]|nr:UDP-N-acetylmuramoyl-L-alanyl-D-glutamate--2,6-diaminopimelate ligase [Terriglobales bacterium]